MFGRRGVGEATPLRCPSVIVRQSSLDDGGDRYALAQDVVNFVNHALREAMFRRDELPQDALRAFHVDYYIAQVNNGGHGQFAYNSRWDEPVLRDIGEGLAAIGVAEATEIFRSFQTYAVLEPARFQRTFDGSGFGTIDPFVEKLDQRFYAGVGDALAKALRQWIARLPSLRPLDDTHYREAMQNLDAQNPEHAARKTAIATEQEQRRNEDPIHQTIRFVCHVSPPGMRFEQLLSASPLSSPDQSSTGVGFRIVTDRGLATIYVAESRAVLWLEGEAKPRGKVPLAMVDAFLARQGLTLSEAVKRGELA